jgi:hypothetical protein
LSDGNEHAGEVILVTLRALRSDLPLSIRLRHLLKRALRDWQLRCIRVEDVPAGKSRRQTAIARHKRFWTQQRPTAQCEGTMKTAISQRLDGLRAVARQLQRHPGPRGRPSSVESVGTGH